MVNNNLDNSYYGKLLERIDDWRLKNAGKHEQHVQDLQTVLAEREQRSEENRNIARRIIDEQTQKEAAAANRSSEREESKQPTDDVGCVRGDENESEETEHGAEGMGERENESKKGGGNEKSVAKAIEEMTFEEFKEIKRGRGRPTKDEKNKKKNSQPK